MLIKILGSAAGGGFPQWNCNCENCLGLKQGTLKARARTQSSIAISDNGTDWILCNASPDIAQQIAHNPELQAPASVRRGTSIGSIILTDSQIDHTTGLLNLREGCPHQVWATPEVHEDLSTGFPIFNMLKHWNGGLVHHPIDIQTPFQVAVCPSIRFTPVPILSNAPPYSPYRHRPLPGHNIALWIEDTRTGHSLFYAPGLGQMDEQILSYMQRSNCLLVDGTLWKDQELALLGVGHNTGQDMGHLALQEERGLIHLLVQFPQQRKVLIHINNTNPILNEQSVEHATLKQLEIEVSYDGMLIEI